MKSGTFKHSYLGETKTVRHNQRQIMEIKVNGSKCANWLDDYEKFKTFEWKYCLFPQSVSEEDREDFSHSSSKQVSLKKISYAGYYASSLKDEIITRAKSSAKFQQNEIIYVLFSIAMAWKEWTLFCKQFSYNVNFFAISSQHVLLNQQGDIKLITPLSSPLPLPSSFYYAPENIPPTLQTFSSWNKSISFSIGLVGAELLSKSILSHFYQNKGGAVKFIHNQYASNISAINNVSLELRNLILLMTDPNPWVRLKMDEFEALLFPYKAEILDGRLEKLDANKSKESLLGYLKSKKNKI